MENCCIREKVTLESFSPEFCLSVHKDLFHTENYAVT